MPLRIGIPGETISPDHAPGDRGVGRVTTNWQNVQLTTTPNSTVTGARVDLPRVDVPNRPNQWISYVTPSLLGSTATIPHGRVYAVLELLDRDSNPLINLWSGYYVATNGRAIATPSTPNVALEDGFALRMSAAQATAGGNLRLGFNVGITPAAVSGGTIYSEVPGTGPGDLGNAISMPNPAAGADFAALTVPNSTYQILRNVRGRLVTDATAANRHVRTGLSDGVNTVGSWLAAVPHPASTNARYWGTQGGTATPTLLAEVGYSLGDLLLTPGAVFSPFITANIQIGDQWTEGFYEVEEWAKI